MAGDQDPVGNYGDIKFEVEETIIEWLFMQL